MRQPSSRPGLAAAFPLLIALALSGCTLEMEQVTPENQLGFGEPVDHLIRPEEVHFRHLWKLTSGGENAEGYFSSAGDRISFQRRPPEAECDRIFVSQPDGAPVQISNGRGTTTCSYFMPGDREVLFASTQAAHEACPPKPDRSLGYVWPIYADFDIYVHDLASGAERLLLGGPGYDAEATVSPAGDRIVFTSTRSGDIDLWTADLSGGDLRQLTRELGYDGGAFFSHDGEWLVYRSTAFTPGKEEEEHARYRELLAKFLVRPQSMELMRIRADGSERSQITHLGGANWAPYFFPSDERVIFSTNHHDPGKPALNFDLFAVDVDGSNLERITFYDEGMGKQFDSFPMFSADGHFLVFASNRGGESGETNLFIAEWK